MKIAIVGAGISGLAAAYLLDRKYEVHVLEKAQAIGGHTATVDVELDGQHYAIDTGFIVFNDWTYPNFIRLMEEVGVLSHPTEMSFSVSCERSGLEYGGSDLNALFAQRKNLLNPAHWSMLRDILRFNREALADLDAGMLSDDMTLGEYLASRRYGKPFISHYLIPMGSAIWSASTRVMLDFPLQFFVRFFKNHGLLSVNNRPQWRVITGGSSRYLEPLTRSFKDRIRTGVEIASIQRAAKGVMIRLQDGAVEHYDQLILACHSDQALALLDDASSAEQAVLGAIPYQDNDVVLHTDERLLPASRRAWSSWNYWLRQADQEQAVLTYNMNILQGITAPKTFCVTLNASDAIRPDTVIGRYRYSHPVFTLQSNSAASQWSSINGVNHTWFCGAYWANGFHEDGVVSAVKVARGLGVEW